MVDYTGHFMTYVIFSFCRFFLVIRVQKWKMTDRLWCKLSALSKHVKRYDKLLISLSEAPSSIEPTARPLYFALIQPKRWYFCDKIKLSDSCQWKYEYTQGEKHLASCATCKTSISTLSLRINEHPYWIKLCYVQSTDTCAEMYCVKYHFKQFNNKWATLKKCVWLTGGLEVSFGIYSTLSLLLSRRLEPYLVWNLEDRFSCVVPIYKFLWKKKSCLFNKSLLLMMSISELVCDRRRPSSWSRHAFMAWKITWPRADQSNVSWSVMGPWERHVCLYHSQQTAFRGSMCQQCKYRSAEAGFMLGPDSRKNQEN